MVFEGIDDADLGNPTRLVRGCGMILKRFHALELLVGNAVGLKLDEGPVAMLNIETNKATNLDKRQHAAAL